MAKNKNKYTNDDIPVKEIKNGHIILDNGQKVTGVKIMPKNIFILEQNTQDAIIVGVGKLGSALFHFNGFKEYGFNIKYGFDTNSNIIGTKINGKKIYWL